MSDKICRFFFVNFITNNYIHFLKYRRSPQQGGPLPSGLAHHRFENQLTTTAYRERRPAPKTKEQETQTTSET